MVTPRVREEVQKHFGCTELTGAELEDQVPYLLVNGDTPNEVGGPETFLMYRAYRGLLGRFGIYFSGMKS
jgi:hypothetical protein